MGSGCGEASGDRVRPSLPSWLGGHQVLLCPGVTGCYCSLLPDARLCLNHPPTPVWGFTLIFLVSCFLVIPKMLRADSWLYT